MRLLRPASDTSTGCFAGLEYLTHLDLEAFHLLTGQALAKPFVVSATDGLWDIFEQVELPVSLSIRRPVALIVNREVDEHLPRSRLKSLQQESHHHNQYRTVLCFLSIFTSPHILHEAILVPSRRR